jgi:glycine/D-amino acid oxidase-like deaminating enzyme
VTAWEPTRGGGVRVATEGGREYEADKLVLAPGAWVGKLVPGLAVRCLCCVRACV